MIGDGGANGARACAHAHDIAKARERVSSIANGCGGGDDDEIWRYARSLASTRARARAPAFDQRCHQIAHSNVGDKLAPKFTRRAFRSRVARIEQRHRRRYFGLYTQAQARARKLVSGILARNDDDDDDDDANGGGYGAIIDR